MDSPEKPEPDAVPVVVLFGPTASGKTEILERLFARPQAGGCPFCTAEIVSADSMQVYRGMDIGTAKPPRDLRSRLPHHLIDIRDPREQFNAGEFVRLADEAIPDIRRRGNLPVVSGGTGFYLSNFVRGLPAAPPSDKKIREALRGELKSRGLEALREELARCDPVSAGRIHLNDTYRLLRALEVFRLSGRPLSSYPCPGASGFPARRQYRFLIIGLKRSREAVYRRIDERCAAMFREGLPDEVRRLWEAGCGPADPGMRAIGYREFFVEHEPGMYRLAANLDEVEALVARNSRRYAKRQCTYFASLPGVTWVDAGANPLETIRRKLEEFLSL